MLCGTVQGGSRAVLRHPGHRNRRFLVVRGVPHQKKQQLSWKRIRIEKGAAFVPFGQRHRWLSAKLAPAHGIRSTPSQ